MVVTKRFNNLYRVVSGSLSYLYIDDRIVRKTYKILARVHICACVYTSKIKVNFIIC